MRQVFPVSEYQETLLENKDNSCQHTLKSEGMAFKQFHQVKQHRLKSNTFLFYEDIIFQVSKIILCETKRTLVNSIQIETERNISINTYSLTLKSAQIGTLVLANHT